MLAVPQKIFYSFDFAFTVVVIVAFRCSETVFSYVFGLTFGFRCAFPFQYKILGTK